jgi:hypothetical protein
MYEAFNSAALVTGIIFLFSLAFWLSSKDDKCWYRRYLLPLMVGSLALVLNEWWAKLAALISAALIYDGYQGYGKEKREKAKKESGGGK